MKRMLRVYIAGPYSANNIMDVLDNIRAGQEAAAFLISKGFAVYCPFLDYQLSLVSGGSCISKEMFQRNSLAWVGVSDALYLLPGWTRSKGTKDEISEADRKNIPHFDSVQRLIEWSEDNE